MNIAATIAQRRRTALAVSVLLVAAVAVGGYLWSRDEALPADAAFAVGGDVFTVDELDGRTEMLSALYGVEEPAKDGERLEVFRRDAAKAFAVGLVLREQAEEMGIQVSDSTVRRRLEAYLAEQLGTGREARDEFVRLLGNVGVSEDDVLAELRDQLVVSRLFDELTGDVAVDDADVRAAYPRFKDRLGVPEKRHLLNIVVTSRDRARMLVEDLRGGADFSSAARRYSIDGRTRARGGDLGLLTQTMLEQEYAKAAFAAARGDLFGPVETAHGWNVGKVIGIRPGQPAPYREVEDQVRQLALFDEQLHTWQEWLAEALQDADIEYADAYRPDDPYDVPTAPALASAPDGGSR